jgi:hypothetical protein
MTSSSTSSSSDYSEAAGEVLNHLLSLKEERKNREATMLARYLDGPVALVEQRVLGFSALAPAPLSLLGTGFRSPSAFGASRLLVSDLTL